MSVFKKVLTNFFFLSLSSVVGSFFGFVAVVYIARLLGSSDFGRISLSIAIITYFSLFVDFGLSTFGARELARNKRDLHSLLFNIILLRTLMAILSFLVLILVLYISPFDDKVRALTVINGLSLFVSVFLIEWVFQGIERMEHISISRVLTRCLYMALIVLFVKGGGQLLLVSWIYVISVLFAAAYLLVVFFFIRGESAPLSVTPASLKNVLVASIPMGLSTLMMLVYINFDSIILAIMRTNAEVGLYNAAYKLVWFVHGFAAAFFTAVFPVVSHLYKHSIERLDLFMNRILKVIFILAVPIAVGAVMLARPIILTVYGLQYSAAVPVFQVLICSVSIIYVSSVFGNALPACDRQNRQLFAVFLGAVVNIGLNFVLIPFFGMLGAAIATVLAEIVVLRIVFVEFSKILRLGFLASSWRPLAASAIMACSLFFLRDQSILLSISAGAVIYFVSIVLVGGVNKDEFDFMRSLFLGGLKNAAARDS